MHNIPSDLVIRKALDSDVDRIALLAEQLGYDVEIKELSDRLSTVFQDQEHVIYVATVKGETIAGWVHAYINKLLVADRYVEIGGLVVEESKRRLGIGRELMACVDQWARDQNCASIRLRSNVIREKSHRFYESLGYQNQKTQFTFVKTLGDDREITEST